VPCYHIRSVGYVIPFQKNLLVRAPKQGVRAATSPWRPSVKTAVTSPCACGMSGRCARKAVRGASSRALGALIASIKRQRGAVRSRCPWAQGRGERRRLLVGCRGDGGRGASRHDPSAGWKRIPGSRAYPARASGRPNPAGPRSSAHRARPPRDPACADAGGAGSGAAANRTSWRPG